MGIETRFFCDRCRRITNRLYEVHYFHFNPSSFEPSNTQAEVCWQCALLLEKFMEEPGGDEDA